MISINSEIGARRFVNPLSILYGEFRPISDNNTPSELNRQTLQQQNIQISFNREPLGATVLDVLFQEIKLTFNKVMENFFGLPLYLSETEGQDILTSLSILPSKLVMSLWQKDGQKLVWLSQYDIPLIEEYGNTRPASPPSPSLSPSLSPSPSPSPSPSNRNRIIDFA
jgi:hypothetical protein